MAQLMKRYMAWLRDAHAMEEQAQRLYKKSADRLEQYSKLHAALKAHSANTSDNAMLLKSCLDRHGEKPSVVKDMAASVTAMIQSLSGVLVSDEVMKVAMAIYTFQHMKIVAYRILIVAAQQSDDAETTKICEDILYKEEATAESLKDQIPELGVDFLTKEHVVESAAS